MSAELSIHTSVSELHSLSDKWVLWAHLPHDTNWGIDSYIKIFEFNSVEEMTYLLSQLKENVVKNCMLFIMRHNIKPVWEDKHNKNGGSFSFKINNKNVGNAWKHLTYAVAGNNITKDQEVFKNINGITVSPKKTFCIMKIWMKDCSFQNPHKLLKVNGLNYQGCLFKKHYNN
jgi:translation initiation factor 4E